MRVSRVCSHLSVQAAGLEVETARGSSKQEIRGGGRRRRRKRWEAAAKIGEVRSHPAESGPAARSRIITII